MPNKNLPTSEFSYECNNLHRIHIEESLTDMADQRQAAVPGQARDGAGLTLVSDKQLVEHSQKGLTPWPENLDTALAQEWEAQEGQAAIPISGNIGMSTAKGKTSYCYAI